MKSDSKLNITAQDYEHIFNMAGLGIAQVSLNGSLLEVNNKFSEILQYTKEELHQKTFQDITHPDDLNSDLSYIQDMLDDKIDNYSMEKRYYKKDGSIVWVKLSVTFSYNEEGNPNYFIAIIDDICDKVKERNKLKETLRNLKKEELHKKLALKAGRVGIWEWDYNSDSLDWDETMYAIYGLDSSRKETPYEMWSNAIDSRDKSRVEENLFNAKATNGIYDTKFWITTPSFERLYIHAIGKNEFDDYGSPSRMAGINTDITEHQNLLDTVNKQQTLLTAVLNSSNDMIFYKDYKNTNGRYIGCNDAFGKLLDKTEEEIIGKNDIELFGEEVGSAFRDKDKDVMDKKINMSNEEWVTYPDGDKVLLHTQKSLLKNGENEIIGILGISRDMTREYNYKKQLEINIEEQTRLSELDPLTGIYNRRSFFDIGEKVFKISKRNNTPLSLLMIDIDLFKNINDTFGHLVGDDVLKYLASEIQARLRDSDVFGRFGGEEFIVLLPSTNLKGGLEIAENIRLLFSDTPYSEGKLSIPLTISIGVSQYTDKMLMSQLIEKADMALYKAKDKGRNRVETL